MRRMRVAVAVLTMVAAVLGLLGLGIARAAPSCAIPADLLPPHVESPSERDAARVVPIGSYTLATFWMPQQCKQAIRGIAAIDCARPEIHAAGLVLHGLWPDGEGKEWPQWCKPAAALPPTTLSAHYCGTPSLQQLQHEWAKHGTCMAGYTPERYFDRAEQLFHGIKVPDLRALSYKDQTVDSVKRAIVAANPGLRPESFRLGLDPRGWLEEVYFCLDTGFRPKPCAYEGKTRGDDKVLIWRGGHARSGGGYGSRAYGRGRYGAADDRSYRSDDRYRGYRPYRSYDRSGN
jgi:ribonuclease T2